jgi:hypothetical protein
VTPPITNHVFRAAPAVVARRGRVGTRPVDVGMCLWNGTCNRPAADHITVADYRTRRAAA